MLIKNIINDLCDAKKITNKTLCLNAGIDNSTLQLIFKRNSANQKTLEKLAKALNVSISVFFEKEEKKERKTKEIIKHTNTEIGTRIQDLIYSLRITQKVFAENLGIKESRLTTIIKGKSNPTVDFIEAIGNAYPEINFDWLLLGNGNKWKEEQNTDLLKEPKSEYKTKCKQCEILERLIKAKDEIIESLRSEVKCLKLLTEDCKRKKAI